MENYFLMCIICHICHPWNGLCGAPSKICCLNLLPAEYFFDCWYLLYPVQGIRNQDSRHLMLRGMRIHLFFPPFISYGPLYKQVIIINLIYFVTFIVYPSRFIFVVQGAVSLTNISGVSHELMVRKYIDI